MSPGSKRLGSDAVGLCSTPATPGPTPITSFYSNSRSFYRPSHHARFRLVAASGRSPVYEATAPLAVSRQDARPHDPVRVAKGPATLRNSVFHPALTDAIIGL